MPISGYSGLCRRGWRGWKINHTGGAAVGSPLAWGSGPTAAMEANAWRHGMDGQTSVLWTDELGRFFHMRACTETRRSNQCRVGGYPGSLWTAPDERLCRGRRHRLMPFPPAALRDAIA